ncbi:outer membrane beta-barrel protein [Aquiflexum sp. LQ15W]|uniref:outer membrane beta-barrel protein n=1 Tax=Cognataquiflexum nitidum TaxID=2922272 RepID=UPI001F12C586|nr:outer membrane beta-barrel protein [Cognataquiflexum nitidum]MCH6198098.1 outer membrane beta-barrel protein [Cognataquiflexum nitidum]
MREQFDKKLVDKIKSSFKEQEGKFDASEWDKFSKVYFKKEAKQKMFWLKWFSGIAAAILLGIMLNILIRPIQQTSNEDENNISITEEPSNPETSLGGIDDKNLKSTLADSNQPHKNKLIEDLGQNHNFENKTIHLSEIPSAPKEITKSNSLVAENVPADSLTRQKPNTEVSIYNNPKTSSDLIAKAEPEQMTEQEAIIQIEEWKGENNIALNEKEKSEDSFAKNPMKLGVLVAPQTISNSTQSINMGAGLMSEFSISKKLKFDVGLAYAQQNLAPNANRGPMSASSQNDSEAFDMKLASFTGNIINSSRELSFGQLEIPMNLKYKVLEKKESDLYLISGVSNMVYLNQQDVTTFSAANISTSNFANSQQIIETYTQLAEPDSQGNGIDTGRMLNFGVGFEQNLKNGTFLSIEPFYKIALGNQTFTNQQFSIGGINLRMNFQLKNKKKTDD